MPSTTALSDCIHSTGPSLSPQASRHRDPVHSAARPRLVFHRYDELEVDVAVLCARAGRRVAVEEALLTSLLKTTVAGERDACRALVQIEADHVPARIHHRLGLD